MTVTAVRENILRPALQQLHGHERLATTEISYGQKIHAASRA